MKRLLKWVAIVFVGFFVLVAFIANLAPSTGKNFEQISKAVLEDKSIVDNTKTVKEIRKEVDMTFKTSDWYSFIKDIKVEGAFVNVYTNLYDKSSNAKTATSAIMTACTGKTTGSVRVLAGARIGDMVEILI